MRSSFRALSAVAVIFGVSGMAYYYQSVPVRPTSLTAQAEEAAEAASNVPLWQKLGYPVYNKGERDPQFYSRALLPGWGWPNPLNGIPSNTNLYHRIYSYFGASVPGDSSQYVLVRDTAFPNNVYAAQHTQTKEGSISVAPNTQVALEWICQPNQQGDEYRCENALCRNFFNYYWEAQGTGFSAGANNDNLGKVIVQPRVTTTYTLQCVSFQSSGYGWLYYHQFIQSSGGNWQPGGHEGSPVSDAVMKITVEISTCDGVAPKTGTDTYKLESGKEQSINITIDAKTYKYCINNPTLKSYLVPAGSVAEMDKFIAAIPSLGLVIK